MYPTCTPLAPCLQTTSTLLAPCLNSACTLLALCLNSACTPFSPACTLPSSACTPPAPYPTPPAPHTLPAPRLCPAHALPRRPGVTPSPACPHPKPCSRWQWMRCCKPPGEHPHGAYSLLPRAGDRPRGRGGDASGAGVQPLLVAGLRAPSAPGWDPHPFCQARGNAEGPRGPMGTPRADVAWIGTARALARSHRPGRGGAALAGARRAFGGWVRLPRAVAEAPGWSAARGCWRAPAPGVSGSRGAQCPQAGPRSCTGLGWR